MFSQSVKGPMQAALFGRRSEDPLHLPHDLYGELCNPEHLQLAYGQITKDCHRLGIDLPLLEAVESEGINVFLRQLSDDLRTETYQPAGSAPPLPTKRPSKSRERVALGDLVVQAALKLLLEPLFSPDRPCDSEPDPAIAWIASVIDKGLTRAHALTVEECADAHLQERILGKVRQRVGDPEIIDLLGKVLAALAPQGFFQRGPLAPLLGDIAFEGIDRILQQARAIGRKDSIAHVQCARFADEIIILLDHDPDFDWILPALQKRLREELSELKLELDPSKTQSVDLARRERLRFLGFELRLVKDGQDNRRVEYKRLKETGRRERKAVSLRWQWLGRYHPLQFAWRYLGRIHLPDPWQPVADAFRKAQSIQVGWRHLPITLYPVLAVFLGWSSPAALLCAAMIVVCNWRTIHPVFAQARRNWLNVTTAVCAIGALVSLSLLASGLEDLADGQVGPDAHGQNDPKSHLASQDTGTAVKARGVLQDLLNAIGSDNLFQEQKPITNPSCFIRRQQTMALSHRHSLPETQVQGKLKVSGGCDLRFVKRYWG